MASDTAQAQEDLDLRTLNKVKDGEVNEMYIFTPLRVGWPPTGLFWFVTGGKGVVGNGNGSEEVTWLAVLS